MKKSRSMIAMTAAVMTIVSAAAPVSVFAETHNSDQKYTYDPTNTGAHDTWDASYSDQTAQPDPSAKINVEFENEPTYTVTIPTDVSFGRTFEDKTNQVKVEDVYLNKGKAVKVTVASENEYKMILGGTDQTTFIPYSLTSNKGANGDVITVPTGSLEHKGTDTATITYSITDTDVPVAGAYSDILTFTIAVVDNNINTGN